MSNQQSTPVMQNAWDAMLAVCQVEEHCLALRKLTCDGSMLKGYTVNPEKAASNRSEIAAQLQKMAQAVSRADLLFFTE